MDPQGIKPIRNMCLILQDQRDITVGSGKAGAGLLYLPTITTKSENLTEGTGRLIKIGKGEKIRALRLEEGMRIVYRGYLRHANPIDTEEEWPPTMTNGVRSDVWQDLKKNYFFISVDDIVGIIPDDMNVGVFSSPAAHAIAKE